MHANRTRREGARAEVVPDNLGHIEFRRDPFRIPDFVEQKLRDRRARDHGRNDQSPAEVQAIRGSVIAVDGLTPLTTASSVLVRACLSTK
jgi:hypothetical protein